MLYVLALFFTVHSAAVGATYWVSPSGTATWDNCRSTTPLTGSHACPLATANKSAAAGDFVYLRGGTYTLNSIYGAAIAPQNSGICPSPPCLGGAGASRIEFTAYTGETPIMVQGSKASPMTGISLNANSWIKITGITFKNFTHYYGFIRNGASYNEVSQCTFMSEPGYESGIGFVIGSFDGISGWATHNYLHHNYLSKRQSANPCGEAIDMIRLGNNIRNPYSQDDYNTLESNLIEHAGHATLATNSMRNVIVNNYLHNEPSVTGCVAWKHSTSTTQLEIGTGTRNFVTQTGLPYSPGAPIVVVAANDYSHAMSGTVNSYDRSTGALTINVKFSAGSGTYSAWVFSQTNVPHYVRSSYNGLYGHRNIALGDENPYASNENLVEGNRVGFASVNPGNAGSTNLDISSPENIARYNFIFGGMNSGIYFKRANSYAEGTGGVRNHVYNNTVVYNGHGWNPMVYGGRNNAYNGQGIAQFSATSTQTYNVIKNNLLFENSQGDICKLGWYNGGGCAPEAYDIVVNNWVSSRGDPLFLNPDLTRPSSQNVVSFAPEFTDSPLPDLRLQPTSPAIDGGTHLAVAVGSGINSSVLTVDDAGYFQDGTRGSDLARGVTFFADWIAVGSISNSVQIQSIDYTNNRITVSAPMSWSDGARIWLFKRSDGAVVLAEGAPDYGASEYGASEFRTGSLPAPPVNLKSSAR